MWNFLRLIRLPMNLPPVVLVLLGVLESRGSFVLTGRDWIAAFTAFTLSSATMAYNGYVDREIDGRKGEPFAKAQPHIAIVVATVFYVATVVSALCLGSVGAWFILLVPATMAYSTWVVRVPILKNAVAALLASSLVYLGGAVAGGLHLVTAVVVFLGVVVMEMVKDVEDTEADRGFRLTLPMIVPMSAIRFITLILLAAAVAASFAFPTRPPLYYLTLVLAAGCFLLAVLMLPKRLPAHAHASRRFVYAGLWFGLLAFLLQALAVL